MIPIPRVFWFWHRAITIWWPWRRAPRVYVPRSYYANPTRLAVTSAHEAVHVGQWKALGWWGFLRRYVTKAGRLDLEAEAFAASVRWYWAAGVRSFATGETVVEHYVAALEREYGGLTGARDALLGWLNRPDTSGVPRPDPDTSGGARSPS